MLFNPYCSHHAVRFTHMLRCLSRFMCVLSISMISNIWCNHGIEARLLAEWAKSRYCVCMGHLSDTGIVTGHESRLPPRDPSMFYLL